MIRKCGVGLFTMGAMISGSGWYIGGDTMMTVCGALIGAGGLFLSGLPFSISIVIGSAAIVAGMVAGA